ncbi:MAG: Ig-like domain-containing protein [Lachnospiraceae bacterium]|nr:Ig-like domain-containing protein [Lachnospiraceae bacterium]
MLIVRKKRFCLGKVIKKTKILTGCILAAFILISVPVRHVHAASQIKGFDVSSMNGVIDWEAVANNDMDFVMLRTGEGKVPDKDTQFDANYDGAKALGLKVGAYHVCCVRTPVDAVKEAKYCLEILDGRKLDYPLAYDIEKAGCFAGGKSNTTAIAKAFCNIIAKAGYTPMIYSSSSYLKEYFDWSKLKDYKVWAAYYGESRPKLPVEVDIWQYTSKGSVEGANTDKGYCDLNYSYMEATSVKFVKKSITMKKGTTTVAKVKINPSGCTDNLKFSSSNKKIVTVGSSTGKLQAKKKGKAVITVKTGSGKKAAINVTVK